MQIKVNSIWMNWRVNVVWILHLLTEIELRQDYIRCAFNTFGIADPTFWYTRSYSNKWNEKKRSRKYVIQLKDVNLM